jgi:hypothetical protein
VLQAIVSWYRSLEGLLTGLRGCKSCLLPLCCVVCRVFALSSTRTQACLPCRCMVQQLSSRMKSLNMCPARINSLHALRGLYAARPQQEFTLPALPKSMQSIHSAGSSRGPMCTPTQA